MSNQSRLFESGIDKNWPKNHKLRLPKKTWLKFYEPKEETFDSIIERARELGRDTFIVATSGGKDSGVVLDLAIKKDVCDAVFFIRTNTGVQITQDFVEDRCQELGIKLFIREPAPHPYVYVAFVMYAGFPDFKLHNAIMKYLKYYPMLKFVSEPRFKRKNLALLGGIRKFESERRKLNYPHPISDDSGKIWFVNPIFYEKTENVYKYYIENDVKISPVYKIYPSSLECGCGSYAGGKSEMEAIRKLDPNRAEFFEDLTEMIKKYGSPIAKRHTTWGGSNWTDKDRNEVLSKFFEDDVHTDKVASLLCGSECGAGTMKGMTDF